jgi:hypothetical protein
MLNVFKVILRFDLYEQFSIMFARGVYPASADLGFGQSFTKAEQLSGVSLGSFIASVSTSVTIFAVEVILFFILQRQLPSI